MSDKTPEDRVHGEIEASAGAALLVASVTIWALDFGPEVFAATGVFFIILGFWNSRSRETATDRSSGGDSV